MDGGGLRFGAATSKHRSSLSLHSNNTPGTAGISHHYHSCCWDPYYSRPSRLIPWEGSSHRAAHAVQDSAPLRLGCLFSSYTTTAAISTVWLLEGCTYALAANDIHVGVHRMCICELCSSRTGHQQSAISLLQRPHGEDAKLSRSEGHLSRARIRVGK